MLATTNALIPWAARLRRACLIAPVTGERKKTFDTAGEYWLFYIMFIRFARGETGDQTHEITPDDVLFELNLYDIERVSSCEWF